MEFLQGLGCFFSLLLYKNKQKTPTEDENTVNKKVFFAFSS